MAEKRGKVNDGYALLVVLLAVSTMFTMLAMVMFSAQQRAFVSRRLVDRIKAKAIAESGCEYAYAVLATNWNARNDAGGFAAASFGGGGYKVTVTPVGTSAALVIATGSCGNASAEAIIGVQDLGGSSNDGQVLDEVAFSYAILCGGSMDFSGCGTISSPGGQSLFHANGAMKISGNTHTKIDLSSATSITLTKVTIGGNVTTPSISKHKKAVINGTLSVESVAAVTIPDIDLTPYYNWALDHGEVHAGGFSTSANYTPNGGIMWVEGSVQISSWADINGSIIATGDIHVSGHVDVNPTLCAFSLVSRDGNITVTSGGQINGLIYAKTGGLSHTANGEINGQIIVNGDIKKAGNSDIMTSYVQSVPSSPDSGVTTTFVGISAWQK